MRLKPAGDRARLVELDDNSQVHTLAAAVRARWGERLAEVVPGHTTLLLAWHDDPPEELAAELPSLDPVAQLPESETTVITVPVRYDGPDLETVAAAAGVTIEDVRVLHSTRTYQAAFIGFSPGFAYLTGGDPRLAVPRRDEPRTRVAAGSVAIAAGYCAIYPSESPGGWQIIGRTDLRLFDIRRERIALIEPGFRVVFEEV